MSRNKVVSHEVMRASVVGYNIEYRISHCFTGYKEKLGQNGLSLEYVRYTSSLQNFGSANLYSHMADHSGASVNNLADLQDFMLIVAAGIKDYQALV